MSLLWGWAFVACLALGLLGQIILLVQPQYGGALIQAAQEGANTLDPLDNPTDPSCCKRPIDYGLAGSDCQDRRRTS